MDNVIRPEFQHSMQDWEDSLIGTPGPLSSIALQGTIAVPGRSGIHRTVVAVQKNAEACLAMAGKKAE